MNEDGKYEVQRTKSTLSLDAGWLNERMKKADLVSYCFPHSLTQSVPSNAQRQKSEKPFLSMQGGTAH